MGLTIIEQLCFVIGYIICFIVAGVISYIILKLRKNEDPIAWGILTLFISLYIFNNFFLDGMVQMFNFF